MDCFSFRSLVCAINFPDTNPTLITFTSKRVSHLPWWITACLRTASSASHPLGTQLGRLLILPRHPPLLTMLGRPSIHRCTQSPTRPDDSLPGPCAEGVLHPHGIPMGGIRVHLAPRHLLAVPVGWMATEGVAMKKKTAALSSLSVGYRPPDFPSEKTFSILVSNDIQIHAKWFSPMINSQRERENKTFLDYLRLMSGSLMYFRTFNVVTQSLMCLLICLVSNLNSCFVFFMVHFQSSYSWSNHRLK